MWLFIVIIQLTAANHDSYRNGWLFFKRTGQSNKTMDEWATSTYSDHSDLDRYTWDLEHMLDLTSTFRSPLLEHWYNMALVELELVLMNADGEELHVFIFDLTGTGAGIYTFTEFISDMPGAEVITDADHGESISVCSSAVDQQSEFKLSVLNVNQALVNKERFILGTGYSGNTFGALPTPILSGCFNVTSTGVFLPVDQMYQCVYHCLGSTADSLALHTEFNGTHDQAYCRCLSYVPSTAAQTCNHLCFSEDRLCGQMVNIPSPANTLGASVYNMSITREYLEAVSDMSQTSTWQEYRFKPSVNTVYSAYFGAVRYIRKFVILDISPHTFTMATTTEDCDDPNVFSGDEFDYHGSAVSNITKKNLSDKQFGSQIFSTMSINELEPVPAMCVFINFTDNAPDMEYILKFQFITSNFVMAEYLAVRGLWENRECIWSKVMQNTNIVPNTAVTVSYSSGTDLAANAGMFEMSQSSKGGVEIRLPHGPNVITEYWIKNITVVTPYPITVEAKVATARKCTDHVNGNVMSTTINGNYMITGSSVTPAVLTFQGIGHVDDMFCGQDIDILIRIQTGHITDPNILFPVNVSVVGCVLPQGVNESIARSCTLQDFVLQASLSGYITTRLVPISDVAIPALRPAGHGLLVAGMHHPSVTIRLSAKHDTELKRVILKSNGTILGATFNFADDVVNELKDNNNNLVFEPSDSKGREIVISNFTPNNDYFKMSIEIIICTNYYGYFYNTTATTTVSASSPTTASSVPPNTASTPHNPVSTSINTAPTTHNSGPSATNTSPMLHNQGFTATNTGPMLHNQGSTTTNTGPTPHNQGSTTTNTGLTAPPGSTTVPGCCCPIFRNLTKAEIDILVESIKANLTIRKSATSKHRRKLISAPDDRPSATYVGCTCGVVVISMSCMFLVIMDLDHIKNVVNIVLAMFRSFV